MGRAVVAIALCAASAAAAAGEREEEVIEQIEHLLEDPIQPPIHVTPDQAAADNARAAMRLLGPLLAAHPGDPTLHYLAGLAEDRISEEDGADASPPDRVRRALAELDRCVQLAPDGAHALSAKALAALLHIKIGELGEGVAIYDRVLAEIAADAEPGADEDPALANVLGNSAEALMALGRLDEAIARYQRAADLGRDRTRALALYGLAVALDRDGQIERSRRALRQAVALDEQLRTSAVASQLTSAEVFFRPRGEQHYYLALFALERGDAPRATAELRGFVAARTDARRQAAPTDERWVQRARALLADVQRAAREPPGRAEVLQFGELQTARADLPRLRRMLERSVEPFKHCLDRPSFVEPVDLELVVELGPGGRVLRVADLLGPLKLSPGALACVDQVARQWSFGQGAEMTLTVPVHLEHRKPAL